MTIAIPDSVYTISLALYFIIYYKSGLEKVFNFTKTVNEIKEKVFIFSKFAFLTTIIVILLELAAPTIILIDPFDSLMSQIAAFSLLFFMILIIIFFHNPLTDSKQFSNFLNTMYLSAPLLFIAYVAQE